MGGTLLALLLVFAMPVQQKQSNPETWKPLEWFVGSWEGDESGTVGTGKGKRTYEFIFGGRYLVCKNTSIFEPQEKNPKGEVHQDWDIFSYDRNRATFVLRQFHIEGFVVQLRQDAAAGDAKRLVFVSESVENGPPETHIRLVYEIKSEDVFVETFEVSGGMQVRLTGTWRRVR